MSHLEHRIQVHSLQRSTPTPSRNWPHMQMNLLLSASTFPTPPSTRGRRESSHGSKIEISQTCTSTLLVCLTIRVFLSLLTLVLPGPLELEIRRHLTLEEEKDDLASALTDPKDDFTETKYLLYGLDLKEQQCVFPQLLLCSRN